MPSRYRSEDPFIGTILDQKYRLLDKIGEGGMAIIYRAEHVFLKELCAIKVIKRPDHRKETQYKRFLREAQLTRKVCFLTPHIARVDGFEHDKTRGVYYYPMELLVGKNLRDLLREQETHRISPQRSVYIAVQVCDGMAISHEQGVIHRDLKPDNIFLSNIDGKQDFVKILDYGLAKPLDPREPALTDMGKVVGTPEYMSPEQCRGPTPEERKYGISHVDARADIYSLGIVLYQCLSGRVPFSLEGEPTPQNFLRLMSRQISEEPRPLHRFRNDIPEALIDVINTALKKNPTERYSSMPEMQQALIKAIPDFDNSLQYTNNKGFKQIILLSKLKHQRPMFSNFSFKIQLDPELEY